MTPMEKGEARAAASHNYGFNGSPIGPIGVEP